MADLNEVYKGITGVFMGADIGQLANARDVLSKNSPEVIKETPTQLPMADLTAISKSDLPLIDRINTLIAAADKEKDSRIAGGILAQIDGSIAAEKIKFTQSAESAALAKFGVSNLKAQLEQNERMDRMHKDWAKYQTDSAETTHARQLYIQAEAAAKADMSDQLNSNPTYSAMMAEAVRLRDFAEKRFLSGLGKEERFAIAGEQYKQSLGVEGYRRAQILFPKESENPAALMGYINAMPNKDMGDGVDIALRTPSEQLPKVALNGNMYAQNIILKDAPAVDKEVWIDGFKVANDPVYAAAKFKELNNSGFFIGRVKPEELEAMKKDFNPSLGLGKSISKEEKIRLQKARSDFALGYMSAKVTDAFNSDLTRLPSSFPMPEFLKAAKADPTINTANGISKELAITLATRGDDKQLIKQRGDQLMAFYSSALDDHNKEAKLQINPLEVNKLKERMVLATAAPTLASVLGNIASMPITAANTAVNTIGSIAISPAMAAKRAMTTPLDQLDTNSVVIQGINDALPEGVTVQSIIDKIKGKGQ